MIVDGKASAGTAGGDSIAQVIEKGLARDNLKALVVRVDSPGGSVLASERIRQAILEAKRRKLPVVVSMGNVAASGGYWVSTPADFIYAEPSTITGSIGVFGILPSFEGTRQKLGSRRRRREDDPAFGRARPAQRPIAGGRAPASDRRRIDLRPLPRHRRPVARARLRSRSTRSPRAGSGTAAPPASSASSTASAAWKRRSRRPPNSPNSATNAA